MQRSNDNRNVRNDNNRRNNNNNNMNDKSLCIRHNKFLTDKNKTPADIIIYAGNNLSTFNEVNISTTISQINKKLRTMRGNFNKNCHLFFESYGKPFGNFIENCIIRKVDNNYENNYPPYFPAREMANKSMHI